MKDTVVSLLEEGYSPEQIKGRSNVEGFAMVSHETMYRWIWEDKRKKGALYQYLHRKGKKYNKRGNALAGRGYIPNRIDIEERPAIVDLKERFGDFGIDTIIGRTIIVHLSSSITDLFPSFGFTNFRERCRPVSLKDH